MNANFCEDLQDYYTYPLDRTNQFQWLREELRSAAKDRFDHLIVEGPLSVRAKQNSEGDKVTVEHNAERKETVFSGWAKTKINGKRIVSPFLQDIVDADDKLYAVQLEKWQKEEEEEKRLFAEQIAKQAN